MRKNFELEEILETIGRLTAKAAGDGAEQIDIHRTLRPLEGSSGISQVLRTARKAFHGDEIFSTGEAQVDAIKGHFDGPRKDLGIKTT